MSDHSKEAALIIGSAPAGDDGEKDQALHQCMEDFHRSAMGDSPNYKGMASALKCAFEIMESEPHDENPEEGE